MLTPKILIVDDERPVSSLLMEVLQREGYPNVEMASDGQEAVEKYKALLPDLVFMDIEMPVMDGYESCSRIKAFNPLAKILVLTGNPYDARAKQTLEEGFALALMQKPLKLKDLRRIVRENLPAEA